MPLDTVDIQRYPRIVSSEIKPFTGSPLPVTNSSNRLRILRFRYHKEFVISTRVRTGRSIRGLRLPPSCSKEERRDVERVVVKGL